MNRQPALVICLLALAFLLQEAVFAGLTWETLAHADVPSGDTAEVSPRPLQVHGGTDPVRVRRLDYTWETWRPATCMPDGCFCERIRDGAVRQPVNTWSNLAFVVTGLLVIAIARRDLSQASPSARSNPMRTQFIYPALYGAATILIGIGSMFYHMSLAFAGQAVDVISMYLLTTFMGLYNLSRLTRISHRAFVIHYLVVNIVLAYLSIEWPVLRRTIFVALALAVLVSELIVRRKHQLRVKAAFLYAALASLAAACAMWILDITRVACSPGSWLQGHAMWHILMAALTGFIYLYYRSEAGCRQ